MRQEDFLPPGSMNPQESLSPAPRNPQSYQSLYRLGAVSALGLPLQRRHATGLSFGPSKRLGGIWARSKAFSFPLSTERRRVGFGRPLVPGL